MSEERTASEKMAALKEMQAKLARVEATTGESGAISYTTKQQALAESAKECADKDHRYRWVNIANPDKVEERQRQGYVRVPDDEGGRRVGNLARFAVPRQGYEQRVKMIEKLNKDRLDAHKTEVENMATAVAKELRDKHGISVDAERILIRE